MRAEQEEGRAANAAPQVNPAALSLVDRRESLKPCREPYRSFDFRLLQCGRPEGHDGSHFVHPYPFDPRPTRSHELTEVEELLAAAGWFEAEENVWRAPWAPGAPA